MQIKGLTREEVNERVHNGLFNKVSRKKTKTISEIFIENIFSLFNFIIFGIIIGIIFFYLRIHDFKLLLDSIGVFTIALVNTSIAVIQEIKAKRALDKVNLLFKKEVTVIRNGNEEIINQSKIVIDDIICLGRGDQIIVDGSIVESNHLEIDESLLTGESVPVFKNTNEKVLSGSFCISGNGFYKAEKVGDESYAANITELAKKYKFVTTPLQKKLNLIVKTLFAVALILCLLEILLNPSANLDNPHFIRKIATILISLIPQGLVLMASVTFAVGVYRISKIGAIIQKLNAIESFSNIKIVCMDKTGTLTKNKLAVESLLTFKENKDVVLNKLYWYSKLSSDKNATILAISDYNFEQGIIDSVKYSTLGEIPFSSDSKFSLLKLENQGKEETLILGAFDLLTEKLSPENKELANKLFRENNLKVFRNLLLGKVFSETVFDNTKEYLESIVIEPYGIISISDQIREDVLEAIKLFQSNDIQFKILSGDADYAIQAIVQKIGWDIQDNQMTNGNELDKLSDADFREYVLSKSIFARLKPEHKLRIIKTLKAEKLYTAMIGDGVNDLPAIKEADMGIAMEEGSQITKEISDIVLLKNKFSLLPEIFNEGNKIVNTVSSVAKLFLTKNFLVIFLSLSSLLLSWEFPFTPRRVSLINIFTIGFPALLITLKNKDISKNLKFTLDLFSFVIISSLILAITGYIGVYYANKYFTPSHNDLQIIMLITLIFTSVSNFLAVTFTKENSSKKIYLVYGLAIIFVFVVLMLIKSDTGLFGILKIFYEINYIDKVYWLPAILVSIVFSISLFYIQKVREWIIHKPRQ
ncbi:MAG TPA: HAD-IC family P-type ATPase [Ignavibacteria bacterium]